MRRTIVVIVLTVLIVAGAAVAYDQFMRAPETVRLREQVVELEQRLEKIAAVEAARLQELEVWRAQAQNNLDQVGKALHAPSSPAKEADLKPPPHLLPYMSEDELRRHGIKPGLAPSAGAKPGTWTGPDIRPDQLPKLDLDSSMKRTPDGIGSTVLMDEQFLEEERVRKRRDALEGFGLRVSEPKEEPKRVAVWADISPARPFDLDELKEEPKRVAVWAEPMIVTGVKAGSTAEKMGFHPGDVFHQIDKKPSNSQHLSELNFGEVVVIRDSRKVVLTRRPN